MRWGLVATVSEPEPLVLTFVAAALSRGASSVRLFLDEPDALAGIRTRLAAVPGCNLTFCDDAYWSRWPQGRPPEQSRRQRQNLQLAYDEADVDWLLHVDADEILHAPTDVAAALTALPAGKSFALVPVAERVYLAPPDPAWIFDGVFRRSCPAAQQDAVDRIDGPLARYLRGGMTSYPTGKGFFRTGRGLSVGLHGPVDLPVEAQARLRNFRILHFDGLTPRAWVRKKQRMLAQQPGWRSFPSQARRSQLAAVEAAGHDEDQMMALYLSLKTLDPVRLAGLDALGLIERPALDLRADLARVFPDFEPDLGMAAFDREVVPFRAVGRWARAKSAIRQTFRTRAPSQR